MWSLNIPDPPADLVVMNANVVTIDKDNPRAEAVAVMGGRIIAVHDFVPGPMKRLHRRGYRGQLDAEGRLKIPGLQRRPRPLREVATGDRDTWRSGTSPDKNIITERSDGSGGPGRGRLSRLKGRPLEPTRCSRTNSGPRRSSWTR